MKSRVFASVLALVFLSANPSTAQVPAGTDCWETDPGTMAALPPIPADFFAPGSAPLAAQLIPVEGLPLSAPELANCDCPIAPKADIVWLDIHGDPVPSGSVHAVSQVPNQAATPDTCVRRLGDATFPGGIGVADPIPIELVELSLQSSAPITVDISGNPTDWNVFILEDGLQAQGQMDFTPAVLGPLAQGDVTVPNLPVNFQIVFVPLTFPVGPQVIGGLNVNMQNPNPQAPGSPGQFQALPAKPIVPALPNAGLNLLGVVLLLLGVVWLRRTQIVAARRAR